MPVRTCRAQLPEAEEGLQSACTADTPILARPFAGLYTKYIVSMTMPSLVAERCILGVL